MIEKRKRVFIIESDKTLACIYKIFLEENGYEFAGKALDIESAREIIKKSQEIDLVLLDIDTTDNIMDNVILSVELYEQYDIITIYILYEVNQEELDVLIGANYYGYIKIPVQSKIFKLSIEFALKKHEYEQKHFIEHKILNNINLGVITFNLEGDIIFYNSIAYEIFNIEYESSIFNIIKDDYFKITNDFLTTLLGIKQKEIILEKNNKKYKLLFSIYNVKKSSPVIYCFIQELVSNYKSSSLYNADLSFKKILNSISEGIFIINRELKLVDYNDIGKMFFLATLEKNISIGSHVSDIFYFLSPSQMKEITKSILVAFNGVSHSFIYNVKIKNANFYFKIKLIPFTSNNSSDKTDLIIISILNKTTEKLFELQVNELETEVKPLFDSSFQRFYLCDLDFKIISFNKSAFDTILKEFNHKLKKGDSILDFVPKEIGIKKFREYFKRTLNYEHISFKVKIENENVGEYWNETHMDPVVNSKGEIHEVLIWTIDITEQEKNIQALRESEARYSLIANGANDGLWDWDLRTNKVYLSPRWKALLGYKDEELHNKYGIHDKLIHPDDKKRHEETLRKYFLGEIDKYVNEIRLQHKKGHYIWVIERGVVLRDENGKVVRMAGSITDITKQKQIEAQLKNAYSQLIKERQMFIDANIVIFKLAINKEVTINYITKNVRQILGYDASDITKNQISIHKLIHPKDLFTYKRILVKIKNLKNNGLELPPLRIRTVKGLYIWIKAYISILNKNTDHTELQGHFMDVTEIIEARKILTQRQKTMLDFIANANDAIIGINKELKIIDTNNKTLEYFTEKNNKIINKPISEFLIENLEGLSWQDILKETQDKKANLYTFKAKKDNGKEFFVECTINPISTNNTENYYLIIRDITKRKTLELDIIKSRNRYKALINAIPDLFFVMDRNGNYIDYKADKSSPLYEDPDIIVGKNLRDFFTSEEKVNEILNKIKETLKTGKVTIVKYEMRSKIGLRKFEARISKYDDDKILSIVRDITNDQLANNIK